MNVNDLRQLVRDALYRIREERHGCFVHNAAAAELLNYGLDAVEAIEYEVRLMAPVKVPRDVHSVMVMYARLIRQLGLGDRCADFFRWLPVSYKKYAMAGLSTAWRVTDPERDCGPHALPDPLRRYVQEALASGTEEERRLALMIVNEGRIWAKGEPNNFPQPSPADGRG